MKPRARSSQLISSTCLRFSTHCRSHQRTDTSRRDVREAMAKVFPGLADAKTDVVRMYSMNFLMLKGVLPRERKQEYYGCYVAAIFRTVRFGVGEAHVRADMTEFNYLREQ